MDDLATLFGDISSVIWGPYMLIPLLLGTGLYLTFRLGGLQFLKLGAALRLGLLKRKDPGSEGDISQFQALTTALAATVGTGNIVGVATAIGIGGPGALFWMWVTGLVGMAAKYSEAYLGVRFRGTDDAGENPVDRSTTSNAASAAPSVSSWLCSSPSQQPLLALALAT